VLAILGTGVQARAAAEMFPRARPFAEVRIAGRGEFEDAVRGADVVAATTAAEEPVVRAEWLSPGTHVTSVGYHPPGSELDPAIVELAGLDPEQAVELGELVSGSRPGRGSDSEITLYKSVGVAIQDLAAAALVLRAARERNIGLEFELEEMHA
jgi:ornithine cyclodeaminase